MLSLRGGRRLAKSRAKNGKLGVMGEGGFRAPGLIPARARGWKGQQANLPEGEASRCAGLADREQGRTPAAAAPGAGGGPHKGGGSGRATVWGARAGLCRRPRPLRAHTSNLLLVTPFTSLLMGPAGAARAGRCGVRSAKTGARAGPGVPGAGGGGGKAPLARQTRRRDRWSPAGASTTARGVRGRDDCQSLARSSPKPQLQPKTKTLPTCQQRRSSLGRAARAFGTPGEGRSAPRQWRRRRREPTPPPPGAAPDGEPASAAGTRGDPGASPPGQAEARGAPKCALAAARLCARACARGATGCAAGRVRARACSRTGEKSRAGTGRHRIPLQHCEDSLARTGAFRLGSPALIWSLPLAA